MKRRGNEKLSEMRCSDENEESSLFGAIEKGAMALRDKSDE